MRRDGYTQTNEANAGAVKSSAAAPLASFNNVRQGAPLPARLKILAWGATRTVDGETITVNEETARQLPANQVSLNWPTAHIDIEHATVPGTPLFKAAAESGRFAAVLGWGVPEVVIGDGLYLTDITWSPQSKRAYEFPDLSGTVKCGPDGTVQALHSVAFCCHGKAEGVHAYSENGKNDGGTMEKKWWLALLGLDETADDQAISDGIAKLAQRIKDLMAIDPAVLSQACKPKALSALMALDVGKLTALSQLGSEELKKKLDLIGALGEGQGDSISKLALRLGSVEQTLTTLSQDNHALRLSRILGDAAAKGKSVPASWAEKFGSDLTVLSEMIDGLPEGVVPLSQMTAAADHGAKGKAAMAAQAEVAKLFGRKPEELKGF